MHINTSDHSFCLLSDDIFSGCILIINYAGLCHVFLNIFEEHHVSSFSFIPFVVVVCFQITRYWMGWVFMHSARAMGMGPDSTLQVFSLLPDRVLPADTACLNRPLWSSHSSNWNKQPRGLLPLSLSPHFLHPFLEASCIFALRGWVLMETCYHGGPSFPRFLCTPSGQSQLLLAPHADILEFKEYICLLVSLKMEFVVFYLFIFFVVFI